MKFLSTKKKKKHEDACMSSFHPPMQLTHNAVEMANLKTNVDIWLCDTVGDD